MDGTEAGPTQGIRASARDEVRRQAALRAGAAPVAAAFDALVRELREAGVPATFRVTGTSFRGRTLDAVLGVPGIHGADGSRAPEWPEEGLAPVAYEVSIDPDAGLVDLAGPFDVGPGGEVVEDDPHERRDPSWSARFKVSGDYGCEPLAALVEHVRDLAIRREVAIQSRPAP